MVKRWLRACCSAALVGALAVGGCTASPGAAAEAAVADPAVQELLRLVPADTPYVWVGLSGSTRPFAEKMAKRAEPLLKQAESLLGLALADAQSDKPEAKVARAIGAELQGKLSIAGLESLGLDFDAKSVIYGIGLLPAARVGLKDPTLLRATIERVQQTSGVVFPVANHGGQDYWHGGDSKFEFVAAFVGNDLVVGLVAQGATRERNLALLFGQEKPASSLADVSTLKDLIAAHALGQYSAGYVDVRGLTDAMVGAGTGFNQETANVLLAGKVPTPECASEIRGLAGLMPRLVFGTTRLDDAGVETRMIAELRPDLAAGLAAVRTRVPGLDGATAKDVMFGFGSGVDVGQAVELAKAQAAVVEAAPFKCGDLEWLNKAAREVVRGVPDVPPAVRQLKGFAFALEDAAFTGFMPTSVKGYVTVGTPDPIGMIKTLKGFAPSELAFIPDLAQEGVAERVNLSGLPIPIPIPFEMFVAGRRDAGLALAIGESAEKRASDLLIPSGEAKPLLVFHMNMGRFMKMMPTGANVAGAQVFDILGSQGYVIDATPQGLVARSWVNFAE